MTYFHRRNVGKQKRRVELGLQVGELWARTYWLSVCPVSIKVFVYFIHFILELQREQGFFCVFFGLFFFFRFYFTLLIAISEWKMRYKKMFIHLTLDLKLFSSILILPWRNITHIYRCIKLFVKYFYEFNTFM